MIARTPSLALAALLAIVSAGHAQDWDSDGHRPPPTWHVNLAIHNAGLSIGNGRAAFRTPAGQVAALLAVLVVIACWLWSGRIMRLPDEERVFG